LATEFHGQIDHPPAQPQTAQSLIQNKKAEARGFSAPFGARTFNGQGAFLSPLPPMRMDSKSVFSGCSLHATQ
jgi:hypothetical protein